MSYKRIIPCIFLLQGKAVRWFDDRELLSEDAIALAKHYSDQGADELLVFDLSDSDEDHEESIDLLRKITKFVGIPVVAGGNIKRLEDVKKMLYAGVNRVVLNFSRTGAVKLIQEAAGRFGKEKIAASLNDFDTLFKHQHLIEQNSSEIIFMHRLDLNSVMTLTEIPYVIVTDTMEESEIFRILKSPGARGISGKFVSNEEMDYHKFKELCRDRGIQMTSFESVLDFSNFKLNSDGLIPVVAQNYKTGEVLMLAYMNAEAFDRTVKTGKMTYYSRSRQSLWTKGETSGHFQDVKSLTIDCDKDTLLAKVEQIGPACHTGSPTCFFQTIAGTDYDETNPLEIFQSVYDTILDRKKHPKEGSYTNSLFDKGIDKILKKVGEEAAEVIIAAKNPNTDELKYELADFLYHAMVLMAERGLTWDDIIRELSDRH